MMMITQNQLEKAADAAEKILRREGYNYTRHLAVPIASPASEMRHYGVPVYPETYVSCITFDVRPSRLEDGTRVNLLMRMDVLMRVVPE